MIADDRHFIQKAQIYSLEDLWFLRNGQDGGSSFSGNP